MQDGKVTNDQSQVRFKKDILVIPDEENDNSKKSQPIEYGRCESETTKVLIYLLYLKA